MTLWTMFGQDGWRERVAQAMADRRAAEEVYAGKLADALADAGYVAEVADSARGWLVLVVMPGDPETITVQVDLAPDPGRYVWTPHLPPFGTVDDLPGTVTEIRAVVGPPTDASVG